MLSFSPEKAYSRGFQEKWFPVRAWLLPCVTHSCKPAQGGSAKCKQIQRLTIPQPLLSLHVSGLCPCATPAFWHTPLNSSPSLFAQKVASLVLRHLRAVQALFVQLRPSGICQTEPFPSLHGSFSFSLSADVWRTWLHYS